MNKKGLIYVIYNILNFKIYGVYTDRRKMLNDYENTNHEYDNTHDWIVLDLEQYVEIFKMATTVIEEKWKYEQGEI